MIYSKTFDRCVKELSKLPGIGKKTALRLSMQLMKMNQKDVEDIANAIIDLKKNTKFCKKCGTLTEEEVCPICKDNSRDSKTICVVEEAKDVFLIEASGRYNGVYHVLGGRLAPP